MTITTGRGTEIKRPTTTPLKSSVLDHVSAAGNLHTMGENEGFGWRNDAGLWVSYNTIETLTPTTMCPEPLLSEAGEFKTFGLASWVPGFSFAVYGGIQCITVGLDIKDQMAELERVFALNEGKGVEQALLGNRFVAEPVLEPGDVGYDPMVGGWDAPTDLTPTDAVTPKVAIGLLEGWFARNYAGIPTIHMPRALGTILGADVIEWKGDLAFTRMGSKIAFGGGYDEEDQDGVFEIYATGEVFVERSATISVKSINLTEDLRTTNGLKPNTAIALVERMFRVAVDGFVAKATATVPAVTGGGFAS